jgi:uncharacterized protein YheU (UPF0270 family)
MEELEIEIWYDEPDSHNENGIEIPIDSVNPETMRNLISEFVTREWEELGDASFTLDQKIEQVRLQLKDRKAKLVFDLTTNSCNIVTSK